MRLLAYVARRAAFHAAVLLAVTALVVLVVPRAPGSVVCPVQAPPAPGAGGPP